VKGYVERILTAGQKFASVVILLFILLTGNDLFSQNIQPKVTRQSSLEAFNKGDFELAYLQFSELLIAFPKDPLYKYYSGVCLVKMQKDPGKAVTILAQARHDGAVVRTIPADALFWLGRAQQMSGKFDEAVISYNDFIQQSGKKAARELGIPEYIQQCTDKKGQLPEADLRDRKEKSLNESDREKPDRQAEKTTEKVITVNEPLANDIDIRLSEALDYQYKADSVNKIAGEQKNTLDILTYRERTEAKARIAETESIADSFQKQADQKFNEVQVSNTKTTVQDTSLKSKPDRKIAEAASQPEGVLSFFKVNPKPVFAPGEVIQINPKHPPGLIYRIQVGVFRNTVAPSQFKGITPVYGFMSKGAALTTYYAGMFRRLSDAKQALTAVRQKGFKDAFIVAFSGGKTISSERAAILEKEWYRIPFLPDVKNLASSPADTVAPALSFRVEVIRSVKPADEESYEGMKKMAGTRGLDIETLPDGRIVYLIGRFITYESAEEYADLLRRNGYRDAKVIAWLGKKEIPVETARQLFDKIE
jgi:tetratricopeptide (TPR) repeat protein